MFKVKLSLPLLAPGLAALLALGASPLAATCGGGGGGGMGGVHRGGGMVGGGREASSGMAMTYQVPWNVLRNGDEVPAPMSAPTGSPVDTLVVYWFPTTAQEAKASDLQVSHDLTLFTARCVSLALVAVDNTDLRKRYPPVGPTQGTAAASNTGTPAAGAAPATPGANAAGPYVVLVDASGKELGRVAADSGPHLKSSQVEKLVKAELKSREASLGSTLAAAREKEKAGDAEGAAALYQQVWSTRCLVPGKPAKQAADALKKLGKPVPPDETSSRLTPMGLGVPHFDTPTVSRVETAMAAGLAAEDAGRYVKARDLYARAHALDRADPVPLRYLGELYRHHLGDWVAARRTFDQVLAMPADPISRAVALHGLGKMTIHEGDFARGLALMESSIATYPLPLTYRNLAVYWNSEGQVAKAQGFAEKALALDPDDTYTQIFLAAFIAEDGQRDEALRIAHQHEDLLAASYNLAAIQCLLGHRDEALALLRRHFYTYERFDAVRSKEMKEAREDIVFTSLKSDPGFIALTAQAEKPAPGENPMPVGPALR